MGCLLAEFKLTAMEAEWRVPVLLVCSLLHPASQSLFFRFPSFLSHFLFLNFTRDLFFFFFQVECQVVTFPLDLERFQRRKYSAT